MALFAWQEPARAAGTPLRLASGIAFDAGGDLYIADAAGHQIWRSTLAGALVLFAGTGVQGYAGDGGPATAAELNQPQGLAFGPEGTLYVADTGNQRIRAISPAGVITTLAGTGIAGTSGDGGNALAAQLRRPTALTVDGNGAVLVSDTGNSRVRRVAGGVISAFAGSGLQGFGGDGGAATMAMLNEPAGLCVAPDGRVFIADPQNQRVRVVDTAGRISTFAGSGQRGFAGDGGPPMLAALLAPDALAWMPDGTLLIADQGNQRIRAVSGAGVITTVAGSGREGGSADGAPALGASMRAMRALAVSSFGIPVVADSLNGTVRELTADGSLYQPAGLVARPGSVVSVQAPAAAVYGSTAAVVLTVAGAAGVPQGRVQVTEGGSVLAGGMLAGANATFSLAGLTAGVHSLSLSYLGDGLNGASAATVASVSVAPLPVSATAASSTVAYGAPLPALAGTLAGVLPGDAAGVQVAFADAAGSTPAAGTYPITAMLTGARASNYSVSMTGNSGSLQVVRAGTEVQPGAVPASYAGMPVTLSATVRPVTSGQPTGTLQFLNGTTVLAAVPVQGGQASASLVMPAAGAQNLSLQYLGDANYLPSTSAVVPMTVAPMPDFAITSSGATTASVASGGSATYALVVSGNPGPFTGAVALSASGLPAGAVVSFSPPQVVPGATSATVTMTVQTAAVASAAVRRGRSSVPPGIAFATLALGITLSRRRRAALAWLLSGAMLLAGCGARTVGVGSGGVVLQMYTVQVSAAATNLAGALVTHVVPVTLSVQQ